MADTLAYALGSRLYLNVTSRCTLACTFCPKRTHGEVWGRRLRLVRQPTAGALAAAAGDPRVPREIVFCGLGEPTRRLDVLLDVAARLRAGGARRLRLNTDGLANLVTGADTTAALAAAIDAFSVSVNAPDAATYARVCPSRYGEAAYPAVLDFVRRLRARTPAVTASFVALPGLDLRTCRRVATGLGVRSRVRRYKPPASRAAWREPRR
ncbi:MAG TPA: TatD family nuclease-associated radical SAM protein [Candidatus Binatia bacterium]|nr:TatD family nuclease-associated radical SAM protein [Candidatus Binatia bacterium]